MLTNMTIQLYNDSYKNAIIELIVGIQHDEYGIAITADDQPDLSHIPSYYQIDKGNFWVALCGDEVIGTIALLDLGHQCGALRKMFVKAGFRGCEYGIGQQLLDTLLTWADEHHFTDVFLGTTEQFVAAHRFYGKNHFSLIDKQILPETFPLFAIDSRFYHRTI